MKATGKEAKAAGRIFAPVKMNVACLLFVRTRSPVEPVGFVKRICQDARSGKQKTRSRYVNRLVPMTAIGKATEQGLVELAQKVLGEVFDLSGKKEGEDAVDGAVKTDESEAAPSCSVCVNRRRVWNFVGNVLILETSSPFAQAYGTTTRSSGTSSSTR